MVEVSLGDGHLLAWARLHGAPGLGSFSCLTKCPVESGVGSNFGAMTVGDCDSMAAGSLSGGRGVADRGGNNVKSPARPVCWRNEGRGSCWRWTVSPSAVSPTSVEASPGFWGSGFWVLKVHGYNWPARPCTAWVG